MTAMWDSFFRQRANIGITRSCMRWYVRKKNQSLAITDCRHSASLVMPIGDPRDGFFYPTLILMMDTYISKLPCILTDETANDVTRIFDSDRGITPYLNQMGKTQ